MYNSHCYDVIGMFQLKESKVFTPSAQDAKAFAASRDNDAKMFSVPSIESSQVFNSQIGDSLSSQPSISDNGARFPPVIGQQIISQSATLPESRGHDPLSQESSSQSIPPKPIGQSSMGHIGQRFAPVHAVIFRIIDVFSPTITRITVESIIRLFVIFRLDLDMLMGSSKANDSATSVTRQTEELAKQTANFMAQFTKQATESIKQAVGVS